MKATLRNLLFVLSLLSAAALVASLVLLALGIRPFIVQSPSMEPLASQGDLAFIDTRMAPADASVGDVVVYRAQTGSPVMHRLVDTNTLRGDANELSQHVELSPANFIGREVFVLPDLGVLAAALVAHPWVPWLISAALVVVACVPREAWPVLAGRLSSWLSPALARLSRRGN